jgi:multidrug resistance efflux pump
MTTPEKGECRHKEKSPHSHIALLRSLRMRLRNWRGSTALSTTTRRPFPWARTLILAGVGAALAYLLVPGYFYTSADALVQGELVPVSPLYRVRIDRLLVRCDDRVKQGQSLAIVSNFLIQADYQRQYLESEEQTQLSRIALDDHVAAAQETAETLHQKYLASNLEAQRLHQIFLSYEQAYLRGAIAQVDWAAKRSDWLTAADIANSDRAAWERATNEIMRIGVDQYAKIASDLQLSAQARGLARRVGSESLPAPVAGYIVDCVDRPQNVVEPGTTIFDIFQPEHAYVLAYFSPGSMDHVRLGSRVQVSINGIPHALDGRVGAIYPALSKLPPQLTRFFWQHVQWSEYRPVRILLNDVPSADRELLYYDAQARVRIPNHAQ